MNNNNVRKIDIHCHTTTRRLAEGRATTQTATLDDIAELMRKHNVEKTALLATYFPRRGSGVTNFRLWHWIKDRPEFLFFGGLDFEHYFYQGLNELEELAEMKVLRGIKIYTVYQNVAPDKLKEVAKLAGRYGLPLMFHAGYGYGLRKIDGSCVRPSEIAWTAEYTNVIISHMANPLFDDLRATIKSTPNVYTDVSGVVGWDFTEKRFTDAVEEVKKFVGECGPEKLLYGTDFPVQSHEASARLIEDGLVGFSAGDIKRVYYENAAKLLGMN